MFIKITPLDTLFFRDGKPFSMGEETWAESSILPNPSVVWGALFSVLLSKGLVTVSDTSLLKIQGIYLQRNPTEKEASKILIPAPLDLFYKKEESGSYSEDYEDISSIISNNSILPYMTKPNTNKKVENTAGCFIDWVNFLKNYPRQNGQTVIYQSTYFNQKLSKIGITRSNTTRTTEEGKLYRVEMNEYKQDWNIIVEFEAPNFPKSGILKLGGEGKTANYEIIQQSFEKPMLSDEKIWFKLYFQTPAFFHSGDGISELSNLTNAKLFSASIGKPVSVGGFDIDKQQPKPMRKLVPAGSIYVFEGNPKKTHDEIHHLLNIEDYQNQGFSQFHLTPIKE
jgi:CRISPR-associated protein Cmr3